MGNPYRSFGVIFVGCMFVGGGIGSLLGHTNAGWLIGMGVGFLALGVLQIMRW